MPNLQSPTSNLQPNKGFTLIELIIYIGIVSIILVSISYLIIDLISGQSSNTARQEVNQNVRFISSVISRDIRAAQAIASLSADTLVLTMPGDDITYNFDAGNLDLTRQIGAGPTEILNSNRLEISGSFSDRSYSSRTQNVQVNFTVSYYNPDNLPDFNASTNSVFSVELRGRK